jgi:hypothetical protein
VGGDLRVPAVLPARKGPRTPREVWGHPSAQTAPFRRVMSSGVSLTISSHGSMIAAIPRKRPTFTARVTCGISSIT